MTPDRPTPETPDFSSSSLRTLIARTKGKIPLSALEVALEFYADAWEFDALQLVGAKDEIVHLTGQVAVLQQRADTLASVLSFVPDAIRDAAWAALAREDKE